MAENEIEPPALGVSWDGTGYGTDGTIWGGEFLLARGGSFERVARFRQFRLPGGEAAIRQPSRTALGVLFEIWGEDALGRRDIPSVRDFLANEIRVIRKMLVRGLNAPVTSSAGRLFDAVASLIGLRHTGEFRRTGCHGARIRDPAWGRTRPIRLSSRGSPLIVDWGPAIEAIVGDVASGRPAGAVSAKFHNTLAEIVRVVALRIGEEKIVLTGGCFQNRYLTEACLKRLLDAGFRPYWHQRVPPNDGGISLGQVVAAAASASSESFRKSTCRRMNLLYAEIIEVFSEHGMQMGIVRVRGARKKIALDLLTNPSCGDTVLLCDGIAIGRVENGRQTEINHVPGNTR